MGNRFRCLLIMDSKEFKTTVFNKTAISSGFEKAHGGWFKINEECIIVLDLQKSNYGDYYQLNIKFFVQGVFGQTYTKSKELVKKDIGTFMLGEPEQFKAVFDFDKEMQEEVRVKRLEDLFSSYLVPVVNQASTKEGVKELVRQEEVFLPPAVKEELGI